MYKIGLPLEGDEKSCHAFIFIATSQLLAL